MLKFHSELLKAMPSLTIEGRKRRIGTRGLFTILLVSVMWYLINNVLPRSRFLDPLYRLHDNVYLVIKGYSFWLFFPTSWIWWGIILTALGLLFFSWASDRSLVREPHIWLLRHALRRSALHPTLLQTTRFFERLPRISADLLIATTDHEQIKLCHQLTQSEPNSVRAGVCRRAIALTKLRYQLIAHRGWFDINYWEALAQFAHLHLLIDLFGRNTHDDALLDLFTQLPHTEFVDDEAAVDLSGLALSTLLKDLRLLLSDSGQEVIGTNEQRRLTISRICHIVEAQQRTVNPSRLRLPTLPVPDNILAYVGDISLTISFQLALHTSDGRFAQGMANALSALRLVTSWQVDSNQIGKLADCVPSAATYRLLSLLASAPHTDWDAMLPLLKQDETKKHMLEWAVDGRALQMERWLQAIGPQEE